MSKKIVTLTRKLEIYPTGENRNEFYSWFRNEAYVQTKAKQLAYNYMLEKEIIVDRMKTMIDIYDNELQDITETIQAIENDIHNEENDSKRSKLIAKHNKAIDKRNKFLSSRKKEAFKTFSEAIGYNERTEVAKIVRNYKDFDGIVLSDKSMYKEHIATGSDSGLADFKNDYIDLMKGSRSPRLYRTYDILDVRLDNSDRREIKNFRNENGKYMFDVTGKFNMAVNLGSKPSKAGQAKKTLEDMINGNYVKRCDSKIQKKNGKFYLLLVLQQEVEQPNLDKNRVMGIDLGMDIPAYIAMEFKPEWGRAFGNKKELLDFKTKIQKLKNSEKHKSVYARGGHGRKRKLKNNRLEALRNRESNFAKTYNHTLSKQIIDYAIKNEVGTIRMEKLDGKSFKDQKMLGNWTYYMLQQMIQTKGEAKGIIIEYVNPAYTSSVCSTCDYHKAEFKLGNRDGKDGRQFHCSNCGMKLNSDHNAAINIARGGIKIGTINKIKKTV